MKPITLAVAAGKNPPDLSALGDVDVRMAAPDELGRAARGADALLVWDFTASGVADAVQQQDRLQWIHVSSTGVDHVLTRELRDSSITVTNTRGVLDQAIAEYVLGLMLAFAKDLPGTLRLQAQKQWKHRLTAQLSGSKALVIGPGSIGRHIGSLLGRVGLQVDAVGRTARTTDVDFGAVYAQDRLRDIVGAYDYVILTAPLTEETRGIVDAGVLAAMKASARIINVARGPLIVEAALEAALHEGTIAGAALDVFDHEPLPSTHPLWTAPNIIVSPHMAGDFFDWRTALLDLFLENFSRFQTGRELLNQIDKEAGYVRGHAASGASRLGQQKAGTL